MMMLIADDDPKVALGSVYSGGLSRLTLPTLVALVLVVL